MHYGPANFHEDGSRENRRRKALRYMQTMEEMKRIAKVAEDMAQAARMRPVEPFRVPDAPLPMKTILAAVVAVTGFSEHEICSPRRHLPLVEARHVFFDLARVLTRRSIGQIGGFCGLDRSTAWHGLRKVAKNRAHYQPMIDAVLTRLGGKVVVGPK